jgi:hypothetical protein
MNSLVPSTSFDDRYVGESREEHMQLGPGMDMRVSSVLIPRGWSTERGGFSMRPPLPPSVFTPAEIAAESSLGGRKPIDASRSLLEWRTLRQNERIESFSSNPAARRLSEAITPAAEKYARAHGLYGSLVLAREIVQQMVPSMKALHVDMNEDPDEGGYTTIRLTITTQETVERVLEADHTLQTALYERIPARALMYLAFMYQFG